MPIECQIPMRPMDREQFGRVSYDVVHDLIEVHNEMGRFFDESIYKRALAAMRNDLLSEVWIEVTHANFHKRFFIDLAVQHGGAFEFKAVDVLAPRHEGQLLNYLMLTDLWHGMVVNVRPGLIERRYVNNVMPRSERQRFEVCDETWRPEISAASTFREWLLAILGDWGTGLGLELYEEALTHFLGRKEGVEQRVAVSWRSRGIGMQTFRLVAPKAVFKLTALEDSDAQDRFLEHAQRLVNHVDLEALLWVNIGYHRVTFRTVMAER